ncbi:hypothetical protein [Streptomyces griseocarneus]|uniref:hypothetical protein n=1 Tax=Streptomyces griseocarneus TaxID=51201 RepID=UPI00167D76A0|nr:hypothetical protein [Streptomyces griseocarneus]MBZ6476898.1 hypothetical protein [Streptomyces griseocarneus]GHG76835.1 hypothetical protein GCM10018779_55450 [Streptomyces griseocarneus]
MTAHEPAAPLTDRSEERPRPLSMRDLLAACAAADAVSTPPKAPGRTHEHEPDEHPGHAEHTGHTSHTQERDAA